MLVIVGSAHDANAQHLAARWQAQRAAVLSCEDLSTSGWRFSSSSGTSQAVVNGKLIQSSEISGILTRRPAVFAQELSHIAVEDREYVAAEMNAFLLAWLAAQTCPVLNRPSAPSLSGPNWRAEQWVQAVARLGIPVRARERFVPLRAGGSGWRPATEVIVVGSQCLGSANGRLCDQSRALARVAGVDLLSVQFDEEGWFIGASHTPSLMKDEVANAVRDFLAGER